MDDRNEMERKDAERKGMLVTGRQWGGNGNKAYEALYSFLNKI